MKHRLSKYLIHSCLLAALTVPAGIQALPSDREAPIRVKAQQSQYDNNKGRMTYTGNVEFEQGTMKLYADKVIVTLVDGKVSEMFAYGNPARLSHLVNEKDKEPIRARGKRIEYRVATGILNIMENAQLFRGRNQMTGGEIEYNVLRGTGNAKGDPSSKDGRMEMILMPDTVGKQ